MAMLEKTFISVFQKIPAMLIATTIIVSGLMFSTQVFSQTSIPGFVLAQNSKKLENVISVRLNGATEYELVEVFGKILNKSQGVIGAKRYGSRIVPDNPSACFAIWRVRIQDPDPSRLQSKIIQTIRDSGVEVDMLKRIRPGNIIAGEIQFMVH